VVPYKPGQGKQAAPDWKSQLKNSRQDQGSISKPKLKAEPPQPSSRLDAIYAQLKNLQNFKDEIMGDLEEFTDDFETKSVAGGAIEVPQ